MLEKIIIKQTEDLKTGMILGDSIYDSEGNILLARGITLRKLYIEKILKLDLQEIKIIIHVDEDTELDETNVSEESKAIRHEVILETRSEAKDIVKGTINKVIDYKTMSGDKIIDVVEKLIDEMLSSDEIVFNLSELRDVDDYIFEHSVNVCILSIINGMMTGFNKEKLLELGIGALLHDIGKLRVDQNILNKPGLLDDHEFNEVKRHSEYGYNLLKNCSYIPESSSYVALLHHERFDGNGYPRGYYSEKIHVYSKICAVSDVFDALTSDRVYGKKISPFKAMEYLLSMVDAHFDEKIVRNFIKVVGFFYRGLVVTLNNGETALVVRQDKHSPVVRVILDKNNVPVNSYLEIDLRKNPSIRITGIVLRNKNEVVDGVIENIN